jgi:hypothetical protein
MLEQEVRKPTAGATTAARQQQEQFEGKSLEKIRINIGKYSG